MKVRSLIRGNRGIFTKVPVSTIFLVVTYFLGVILMDSRLLANRYAGLVESDLGIELRSSVMWNKRNRFIYPPGIPAVLLKGDRERNFLIEQYYSRPVDSEVIKVYIRGPWYGGEWQQTDNKWFNRYVGIGKPDCLHSPTRDGEGKELGFRCLISVRVDSAIPAGGMGVAVAYKDRAGESVHPNGVFWFIFPEESGVDAEFFKQIHNKSPKLQMMDAPVPDEFIRDAIESSVVRITRQGRVVLGSGFVTRETEPFEHLFPALASSYVDRELPCGGIYLVTASHLFPSGFSAFDHADGLGGVSRDHRIFFDDDLFDIQLHGRETSEKSAVLIAKNEEVDLALLYLNFKGIRYVSGSRPQEQLTDQCASVSGLTVATDIGESLNLSILGFSGRGQDNLLVKSGVLLETATEDTSNIGPVSKLKIVRGMGEAGTFAEDGMSGGPVLNLSGEVIGISVERPIANNSLIALDLTSLRSVKGASHFLENLSDPDCVLRFNPFDRVMFLVNNKPGHCEYGDFGSPGNLRPLSGTWRLQEVLSIVDESKFGQDFSAGGYVGRNGHSIISGQLLINGQPVLRSGAVIVSDSSQVARVNADELLRGYKVDPRSWAPMVSVGVRVLHSPFENFRPGEKTGSEFGVINKVRSVEGPGFYEDVYSARALARWLRSRDLSEGYFDGVCYLGGGCLSSASEGRVLTSGL